MNKLRLLFLMLFIIPITLFAQNTITGVVKSDAGEALPGVTIVVEGTTQGTTTNLDGEYSILAPGDGSLTFSFIGYLKQTIPVKGKSNIDVTLRQDFEELEQVVVIGYGSVKKSDLTGSVVSLSEEDLNKGLTTSVDQMLTGRAPGVNVYQNSSEPGGGMNIQIRGVGSINAGNEPLYVIDGLPVDNSSAVTGSGEGFTASRNKRNPLNALSPNDIQSIEVLKDASATAIYGSRGANGVILITTKKGSSGKLKVNYDAYYGVQKIAQTTRVMTADEYMTTLNELYDADAVNASVGERVEGIVDGGTNWQDEVFRNAPVQSHNLSFSGGDENTKCFVSLGYFNQEGVVISSALERYSARLNVQQEIKDKFRFGANLNSSYVYDDFVPNGIVPNEAAGVVSAAIDYDPTLAIIDPETGVYSISPFITKDNPLAVAHGKDAYSRTFRTFGTAYGEYFILPELSVKLNLGGDVTSSKRDVFVDSTTKEGQDNNGMGTVLTGLMYNYLAEATVNYHKDFNDVHSINLMAGATTQKFFIERFSASAKGFISETTGTNSLQSGTQATFDINTSKIPNTLLSYLGRANYNYNDKVLLTATIRADGSSRFGENNKFAYFPSTAVAWKLGNEDFIKDLNTFSTLKLRAGWGKTGNQEIGNFRSLTTFRAGGTPMVYGDTQYVVMEPSRMANPDLKWETTTQTNIGIDAGIFDGRISGSFDYFFRNTTDLLLALPVPSQTGFATKLANVGEITNKGWEVNIDSRNFVGNKFTWSTNLNFSSVKNEVIDLGEIDYIMMGGLQFTGDVSIIKPGEVMNSYYGVKVEGVWQEDDDFINAPAGVQPGDWKYKDQITVDTDGDGVADAGDGKITADDRVVLGDPLPDFTWGMTNDISFGPLSLTFNIQGVHGVQLLNNQLAESLYPINFRRNKLADPYLNRWTPDNPSNEWASFVNPASQGTYPVNSKTVEDAGYVRLQNVTLGYDLPVQKGNVFSSFNIYVSATNLVTITNYSGIDPGANVNGTSAAAVRIDYNAYPLARTFTLGVNVGF
ncbi:TonB-dependent receptor [Draconibacterium orientale]|uniref:SusC/RagA family TonB-linked outer membrane protein n=1 Tax=Draconibacterium orientale TaxID=1168034 RepID=UPI002ABD23EA|nr:TonB-dependent receptor [Draconibacterium orientale]